MARNFEELQEELESTNNPYRNTAQMEHGSYVSPYQKFKQQYPEFDAYGNKVLSGGYFKDNLRRFQQAGRNARLELQGQQPETEDNLLDYFGMGAMTVFHGSPHKFSKFSMDNIGTGEGAQAYGHGLYFAENPKVAGEYKDTLGQYAFMHKNKPINPESIEQDAAEFLWSQQGDVAEALMDADGDKALQEAIRKLDYKELNQGGHIYEVDIPDEHVKNFLDWDAPLSEQPESVRKALEAINPQDIAGKTRGEIIGSTIYDRLARKHGKAETSEYLNKLGIKGIKYFDGSSRTAGQGTRNMVVFDDSIINTLKRNNELIE